MQHIGTDIVSAAQAGIKAPDRKDIALIFSEAELTGAGVYTTNKVKAAPLLLTKKNLEQGTVRALVVNSGNANVCNGSQGMQDAQAMAEKVGTALQIPPEQVLVASTGVIGQPMPMHKVLPGIAQAAANLPSPASATEADRQAGGRDAAEAIMTTDTVSKQTAVSFDGITLGGMAKGSGMIHPNMATLLGFITTDAAVEKSFLQKALKTAVDLSFNMISVDGDTSTNDMVLLLANGLAQNPLISENSPQAASFQQALNQVCLTLAKAIAADGEGATKLIEVTAEGAKTLEDARQIAKSVVSSSLFKAAVFGRDANWGRILCAAGYSGADFDPEIIDIYLGEIQVAKNGRAIAFDEEQALVVLSQKQVTVRLNLHQGNFSATAWGCDLTYEYVKINGEYRT
ncbi:MAG: bifunctional glutamate N-acetyltransferase/amino-acid acetyltransferase ArgJ [Clostridia bacterium]|nr:bifunctional glutamate N-acetyltransferase/amino-acid acetyltransferase ArgJ [Clostridia bacterium]